MSEDEFKDIEMLEIPEDLSDTESISEGYEMVDGVTPSASSNTDDNLTTASSSSDTDEANLSFAEPTYIKLQDWLVSNKKLEFQFDPKRYAYSLKEIGGTEAAEEVEEENALFKVFEQVSQAIGAGSSGDIDDEDDIMMEPIGVISGDYGKNSTFVTKADRKQKKQMLLNTALNQIIEIATKKVSREASLEDGEESKYHDLLSILECLKANFYYDNAEVRPELLTTWINRSDPKPDIEITESVMINTPKPYLHPQFWNTYIAQLLVRGLLGQAVNAIEKSSYQLDLSNTNGVLKEVIDDLKSLLQTYTSMSLRGHFAEWKLTCCEFRDSFPKFKAAMKDSDVAHCHILSQIYDLLGILTGLPKTIASFCTQWYEVYTALALYQVRGDDSLFKEYLEIAQTEKPPPGNITSSGEWDSVCWNLLQENLLVALGNMDNLDQTTTAYISRLFELGGYLNNYYPRKTVANRTISEYLISKYAFMCLNNHKLVPIGIGLLLNESVFQSSQAMSDNRTIISKILPLYECMTNDDLEWSLTICAKLNLRETAQELYLKYGEKSLKDGYLYEAMNMFVNATEQKVGESNGMERIHHIVWDLIFQDSLINNRPIKDELINNIVKKDIDSKFQIHPVIRQCLSPYAVLVEFFNSIGKFSGDEEDFVAMNKLSKLRHLLRFNFLPKKYYPLLLAQFLPFLINQQYQFQLPDLIIIIELIDSYDCGAKDLEQGNTLYKYSIKHIESEASTEDWRSFLKNINKPLPKDVQSLIKEVRLEVLSRIGRVYIEE